MPLLLVITSYTIVQSLLLSVRFLVQKNRHFRGLVFSLLLILIALDISNSLSFFTDVIFEYPHLLRIQTPLTFLYGPALYFIISSYYTKNEFSQKDLLHLIPFALILLSLIPVYMLNGQEKILYLNALNEPGNQQSLIYGLLRRVHIFIYLMASLAVVHKLKINRRSAMRIWIAFFGIWLISMYRLIFDFELSSVYLDMIYINAVIIYFAFIFSNEIKIKQAMDGHEITELADIMKQVNEHLVENEGYKNNMISVSSLSKKLRLQKYKLSKAINLETGMHFFDYLNKLRVEKAMELLRSESGKKIDDISVEVGYNSISTFNTAFKKIVKMTPREFRKLSTS